MFVNATPVAVSRMSPSGDDATAEAILVGPDGAQAEVHTPNPTRHWPGVRELQLVSRRMRLPSWWSGVATASETNELKSRSGPNENQPRPFFWRPSLPARRSLTPATGSAGSLHTAMEKLRIVILGLGTW
jgi:hypothetical protein